MMGLRRMEPLTNIITLQPALLVQNLSKTFDGRTVVDRLSFSIAGGEIVGLVGLNGQARPPPSI